YHQTNQKTNTGKTLKPWPILVDHYSLAYTALKKAKEGDFVTAKSLMAQSHSSLNEAHKVQTQLIESDMGEGRIKVSLVLVHAQDHLMNAMLARELITELIELHEKLNH
ncbi:PTS lactose/cellobiose transporter subunit IIA, partial [Providencia rettgeri]